MERIDIAEKLGRITEPWRPGIIAELNGQELKAVKIRGEFPWHRHDDADEMFLGWKGRFRIEFRDRTVEVGPGQCVVVPRGVEHRPVAEEEAEILLPALAERLSRGTYAGYRCEPFGPPA